MGLNFEYIDGQTAINEDEKEGLKIKSITTQNELNELEQLNIEKAVLWTLRLKYSYEKILTEEFVKKLHYKMYSQVWKWAGEFRRTDKNIGVEWIQVGIALRSLLEDTRYWIRNETYLPEEIAIRLKHRIVSIHCFPNGNGRHSRLLADIVISTVFKKPIFTWNHSNMVKANKVRKQYILALRIADQGDIKPLVSFARK